jgi:hypothetical protein
MVGGEIGKTWDPFHIWNFQDSENYFHLILVIVPFKIMVTVFDPPYNI